MGCKTAAHLQKLAIYALYTTQLCLFSPPYRNVVPAITLRIAVVITGDIRLVQI